MNKICCLLVSSLSPPYIKNEEEQKRHERYLNGLNKFFEKKYNNFDYYFIDNTVQHPPKTINDLLLINNCKYIFVDSNEYGKFNKGAGVIETLKSIKNIIDNYEWIVYFEPRQILIDHSFIETFNIKNNNLFTLNKNPNAPKHFNTGFFCINAKILKHFLSQFDEKTLQQMVDQKESIEYIIYNYFINNKIVFDTTEKMNLFWNDSSCGIDKII